MATGVVGGYGDGETGRGMCGQVRTINENERGGAAELLGIPPWELSSKLKRLGDQEGASGVKRGKALRIGRGLAGTARQIAAGRGIFRFF